MQMWGCRVVFKPGLFCSFQTRTVSSGAIGKEDLRFFVLLGCCGQDGVVAGGVQAEYDLGAQGPFAPQALGANGDAPIGADLDGRADTPNIRPPRATGDRAQDRAFLLLREFPGALRGQAQLAMDFVGVAMAAQSRDVGVGGVALGDLFAGEIASELLSRWN